MHGTRVNVPVNEFLHHLLGYSTELRPPVTQQVASAIRRIDNAVEEGNWRETPKWWALLESLTRGLQTEDQRTRFPEIQELRRYERYERQLRCGGQLSPREMRHVLSLKSADINIYRKVLSLELAQPVANEMYDALRTVDVLRELFDDIQDVREDLQRPNFNFVILAQRTVASPVLLVTSQIDSLLRAATVALAGLECGPCRNQQTFRRMTVTIRREASMFRKAVPEQCCQALGSFRSQIPASLRVS